MTADITPESPYTPTTEAIAKVYSAAPIITEANRLGDRDIAHNRAAFYRWKARNDAEVARKALLDAADEEFTEPYPEDVFAPLSESDNIDINSTLADYDVPSRDRISADMFRRAGNRLRARAEQIGENCG